MSNEKAKYGKSPIYGIAEKLFADIESEIESEIDKISSVYESESQLQQQSIEWFLHRWDKFTGSKITDLMKSGRGKGELWGETAKNVILKIASYANMTEEGRIQQAINEMQKDFYQTRWGNDYEPEARTAYAKKTGYLVNETGFTVHRAIPYLGGSFDGEVLEREFPRSGKFVIASDSFLKRIGIIEIKCPIDPVKHEINRNLQRIGIDVKHEYYGQIQCNIEVAGVDWCDFVSYDPRCEDDKKLVIIRVNRDQIYIDAMLDKVHKAKYGLKLYLSGTELNAALEQAEKLYPSYLPLAA